MNAQFDHYLSIEQSITQQHYDYVFLSPHLDDVVLSCSGALSALQALGKNVLVITLFAGDPQPPFSTLAQSFHLLWQAPEDAPYATRKTEERQAMGVLQTDYLWMGWLDVLYRQPQLTHAEQICDPTAPVRREALFPTLCQWFSELAITFPSARFVAPLAIGAHRDHLLTHQAAWAELDHDLVVFYEDFPYVAFQPQEAEQRASLSRLAPFSLDISPFLERRIQATLQYQSQLDMLCHPPRRIEEVIRHATRQQGKGTAVFCERYWTRSATPFPLLVHAPLPARETNRITPEERQQGSPSFQRKE